MLDIIGLQVFTRRGPYSQGTEQPDILFEAVL